MNNIKLCYKHNVIYLSVCLPACLPVCRRQCDMWLWLSRNYVDQDLQERAEIKGTGYLFIITDNSHLFSPSSSILYTLAVNTESSLVIQT